MAFFFFLFSFFTLTRKRRSTIGPFSPIKDLTIPPPSSSSASSSFCSSASFFLRSPLHPQALNPKPDAIQYQSLDGEKSHTRSKATPLETANPRHVPQPNPVRDVHAPAGRRRSTPRNIDPGGRDRTTGDRCGGAGDGCDARAGVL